MVTGYASAPDWSAAANAPENDGVFAVDVARGVRKLDDSLVRYHVDRQAIVVREGQRGDFADPGGDNALSPDRQWLANGHKDKHPGLGFFTFLHRQSGRLIGTRGVPLGNWRSGEFRIDPASAWNRESNQILFGALDESTQTRQLFVLTL